MPSHTPVAVACARPRASNRRSPGKAAPAADGETACKETKLSPAQRVGGAAAIALLASRTALEALAALITILAVKQRGSFHTPAERALLAWCVLFTGQVGRPADEIVHLFVLHPTLPYDIFVLPEAALVQLLDAPSDLAATTTCDTFSIHSDAHTVDHSLLLAIGRQAHSLWPLSTPESIAAVGAQISALERTPSLDASPTFALREELLNFDDVRFGTTRLVHLVMNAVGRTDPVPFYRKANEDAAPSINATLCTRGGSVRCFTPSIWHLVEVGGKTGISFPMRPIVNRAKKTYVSFWKDVHGLLAPLVDNQEFASHAVEGVIWKQIVVYQVNIVMPDEPVFSAPPVFIAPPRRNAPLTPPPQHPDVLPEQPVEEPVVDANPPSPVDPPADIDEEAAEPPADILPEVNEAAAVMASFGVPVGNPTQLAGALDVFAALDEFNDDPLRRYAPSSPLSIDWFMEAMADRPIM